MDVEQNLFPSAMDFTLRARVRKFARSSGKIRRAPCGWLSNPESVRLRSLAMLTIVKRQLFRAATTEIQRRMAFEQSRLRR
jgi:hypothetical protein